MTLLRKPALLDAGLGDDLKTRGVPLPPSIWSANALLTAPDVVLAVHRDNIAAGADVVTTNTFGIVRAGLRAHGLEHRYAELNAYAAELARQAVAETRADVRIAASLPPLNGSYRPDRVRPFDEIAPQYAEQAALLAPFVDLFLCETMSHTREAVAAARGATATGKPVVVSFTLDDHVPATLRSGESLADAIHAVMAHPIIGVAANCCPPERISDAMPTLVASGLEWTGGWANAFVAGAHLDGTASGDAPPLRSDLTPEAYARFARAWIDAGATLVGGCCGTTAAHTAALRRSIDARAIRTD